MPELPTGTVTFLFTDIEGSTVLWEQHRDAMRQALIRHDVLAEQIVVEHDGHVVRPRGESDSRFAVFARATDAVAAAATLQQALYAEPWSTPTPLRVRMALHTGEADLRDGDYYGSAVNRCARLRAVTNGGQTLVSLATEQVVRGQLSSELVLRDLGEHRLKDLQHSERVFQLITDGVPSHFPALKTLDARPHNLPLQPTSFIGREQEIATVCQRLLNPAVRLLTMIGPGGTGKTRLALQVAAELLEDFSDGVWLVELAPTHDPALVASAIAAALGVKESGAQPLIESLKLSLHSKQLLLVLDNFEQVLAAAPIVAELLQAAPALKVLVTSRAPLHLRSEREVAVPPLSLPLLTELADPLALEQVTAVRLFVERARDARADFVLTPANAAAVAEICGRLDGLPLAIELAAARSKMLAPKALLARLQSRLKLLTGGAHDLPTRQQTIRGTIDWSFNLLETAEQRLFTRLGVFVGGWTVEAAEAVCDADGDLGLDMLDGLQSLFDKSLLRQVEGADGEPRFRRLETIREYAVEQLAASGEADVLRARHLAFFLQYAVDASARSRPGERLGLEQDNLRAALAWALGGRNVTAGMQLLHASEAFWLHSEQFTEWVAWLEQALACHDPTTAAIRAKLLYWAGWIAYVLGASHTVVVARFEESRALFQEVGDTKGEADVLSWLAMVVRNRGDYAASTEALEQALALYQALGDAVEQANMSAGLGAIAIFQGDYSRARTLLEQSVAEGRALGSELLVASGLHNLGEVALLQGEYEQAARWCTESMTLIRRLKNSVFLGWSLHNFGYVAAHLGDLTQAEMAFRESLELFRDRAAMNGSPVSLAGVARVAASQGQPERAARLLGAAETLGANIGGLLYPVYRVEQRSTMEMVQARVDPETFAAAWAEGQAMTMEQVIAYALEEVSDA